MAGAARKAADGAQRMAGYEPGSRWQGDDDDDEDEEWYVLLHHDNIDCTHNEVQARCFLPKAEQTGLLLHAMHPAN